VCPSLGGLIYWLGARYFLFEKVGSKLRNENFFVGQSWGAKKQRVVVSPGCDRRLVLGKDLIQMRSIYRQRAKQHQ
jgi:hypothetical protein